MSKKPILSKHPKKLIALILACLITITLTGCDSNRKPTGDLDLSAVYASNGNHSVTVGDVYNKLRYNAVSYVENAVYNFLYEEEIETVKTDLASSDSKYREKLEHEILHDIYDVHEEDEIEDLTEKEINTKISTYVDEMYQKGYVVTAEDIKAKNFKAVEANYYLEVAKYVAAYNKLAEEFTVKDGVIDFGEITDDSYFTKDEVVHWYEQEHKNTGDVTAILIRFINSTEVNNVLKKFGLKSSGGKWYQIKLDPSKESEWNTKNGYEEYYDDYKIDLTGESGLVSIDELGNGNATVLKVFAEIYNYVYTYRNPIVLETVTDNPDFDHLKYYRRIESIINKDFNTKLSNPDNTEYETLLEVLAQYEKDNNETIVMSKEKLDKYSTSLTSYLYTSLATEAKEEGKSFTQYITTGKSFGNYYYLLYKIDQVEDKVLYEEVENEDDKKEINFTDTAFLNEVLNEMFENELSDTYIEKQFTERVKEAKLKIYDSIVESQFMYTSSSALVDSYEKNKKQNNNVIAEVTYKDNTKSITVSEVFSYLEPLHGTQVAANLLFQEYIKTTDYYKDLADDYDNYVETVKLMLYYFSNDYYAQSGYPSSIGKYNFMMLYYGTANVDEVVKDFLMVSDATNKFYNDFAKDNNEFYTSLLNYATKTYSDFYSLTVSGLTVYVDRDEDGVADEITDSTVLAKANELLEVAYDYVTNSNAAYSTALNNVVSAFNSSSRIESTNPTSPEYDWAAYRSLGLHIEVSSFGTFTDTTATKEEAIKDRVANLYDVVVDSKLGFTSAYLDNETVETSDNKLTKLLVTAGALPTSAKYETENEDESKLYESINVIINDKKETINLTYTTDEITLEQVKVYVAEHLLLGDVYSLPASTIAALDAYLLPLINKYTGSASQMTLTNNALGTITFSYTGALSDSFNEAFAKDYSRSTFYSKYISILQNNEDNYEEVYTGWWNNMYKGGSN
jgi:hypothetical protein